MSRYDPTRDGERAKLNRYYAEIRETQRLLAMWRRG